VEQSPRNRSGIWLRGNDPLTALEAYLAETDRFDGDPVVNGKLILSSSPGGYLRCRPPTQVDCWSSQAELGH
jgi:cephalosporin hydroxylase